MSNSLLAGEQPVPCQNTQGATVPTGMLAAADSVLARWLVPCPHHRHPNPPEQRPGAPAAEQEDPGAGKGRRHHPLSLRHNEDSAGLPPISPPHHLQEKGSCTRGARGIILVSLDVHFKE